jgi:transglutaminase-like putative cysteine protease
MTLLFRLLLFVRFPIRLLAMVPITLSMLWGYVTAPSLFTAVLGALCGVVAGELAGRSRLRKRSIALLAVLSLLLWAAIAKAMLYWPLLSTLVGPSNVLLCRGLLISGLGLFSIVAAIRALALRSRGWASVEFWCMALASAVSFAPHRDRAVMHPLWLSDWAWRYGLDPTVVFGALGAILALLLAVLTLLEHAGRVPASPGLAPLYWERTSRAAPVGLRRVVGALLLLPLLALLALFTTDPSLLKEESASALDVIKDGMQAAPSGARGGQSDTDPLFQYGRPESDANAREDMGSGGGSGGTQGQAFPVAVVVLETDYEPPSEYFYLRQEAYSDFVGKRLQLSLDPDIVYDGIRGFPGKPYDVPVMVPDFFRTPIEGKVALLTPHTSPFGVEGLVSYRPTINPRPSTFVRTYAFTSLASRVEYSELLALNGGNSFWSDAEREHHLETSGDPRFAELAQEIVSKLPERLEGSDFAKALLVKLYLDERMKYTLRIRHSSAADPTAEFLFGPTNQFIGYCVHSAHAAALLWRELGIPSRIGIGYAVDAQGRRGAGLLVMNSDAHAWPELYLDGMGWVILDIAPSENLDPMGEPQSDELLDSLVELASAQENSEFRQAIDWAALWSEWKWLLLQGGLELAMLLLLLHYMAKLYRRMRIRWRPSARLVYISALDQLSEVGFRRLYGETREDFARRIAYAAPSFIAITRAHLDASLGGLKVDSGALVGHLAQLPRDLREEIPLWRLAIGAFNPISFYASR